MHLRPGGALLLVHSSVCGVQQTCRLLREHGLQMEQEGPAPGTEGPLVGKTFVITGTLPNISREKATDHFNGQFTLLIWNDGGKIKKRIDPVGLTAGEHFGTDSKVYTKIKFTRAAIQRVMTEEEKVEAK